MGSKDSGCEIWAPDVVLNKLTRDHDISRLISITKYWTPLTDQAEESDPNEDFINNIMYKRSNTAVFDTAATSSAGKPGDNFIPTTEKSSKIFNQPSGAQMKATYVHKLKHPVREPARRVDIVPTLKEDSLISGPKFADAEYVSLLTPEELMIFDGQDLKITVSKEAVLSGWRDKGSRGMWRIPLEPNKPPQQSKYVLLDEKQEE